MIKFSEQTEIARFKSKTEVSPTGCIEWQARLQKDGYGMFWKDKTMKLAHRAAYEFAHGQIPHGFYVLHTCDNPRCVNTDHLFIGTQNDNMQDAKAKGRIDRIKKIGEGNGRSKLDIQTVKQIKQMLGTMQKRQIARLFNVSDSTIGRISNGETWGEV